MAKTVRIVYHQPSDELNILLGEAQDSVLLEIDDEVYVRLHPETDEVLGLTVLNFEARTRGQGQELPVLAHFDLPASAWAYLPTQAVAAGVHESPVPYATVGENSQDER